MCPQSFQCHFRYAEPCVRVFWVTISLICHRQNFARLQSGTCQLTLAHMRAIKSVAWPVSEPPLPLTASRHVRSPRALRTGLVISCLPAPHNLRQRSSEGGESVQAARPVRWFFSFSLRQEHRLRGRSGKRNLDLSVCHGSAESRFYNTVDAPDFLKSLAGFIYVTDECSLFFFFF